MVVYNTSKTRHDLCSLWCNITGSCCWSIFLFTKLYKRRKPAPKPGLIFLQSRRYCDQLSYLILPELCQRLEFVFLHSLSVLPPFPVSERSCTLRWMPYSTCLSLRQTEEPLSSSPIMQSVWGWELNASCVSLWPKLTHCIPPKVNVWWRRDGEPEIHRAALFSISGTAGRRGSQGQCFMWIRKWMVAHYLNQHRCTVFIYSGKNEPVCSLCFSNVRCSNNLSGCSSTLSLFWLWCSWGRALMCGHAFALTVEIRCFPHWRNRGMVIFICELWYFAVLLSEVSTLNLERLSVFCGKTSPAFSLMMSPQVACDTTAVPWGSGPHRYLD